MEKRKLEILFFLFLFAIIGTLTFHVFKPLLNILLLSAIFAILLYPLYEETLSLTRGKRGLSAGFIVLVTGLFVVVPVLFLFSQIFQEARDLYVRLQGSSMFYMAQFEQIIEAPIQQVFPDFSVDTLGVATYVAGFIAENLGPIVSGAAYVVVGLLLSLIALFAFLRDGKSLAQALLRLSPLENEYNQEIIMKTRTTINSVVKGTLLVAVIQGTLVSVGFTLVGIPDAVLWGTVSAIFSLIPGLGTGIVTAPAVVYLLFQSQVFPAILLAVWGAFVVGLVDNFLAPYFYGKGSDIPHVFILFSVLGGLVFFGPLGFLFGPIVLSLFVSVLHIYRLLILGEQKKATD